MTDVTAIGTTAIAGVKSVIDLIGKLRDGGSKENREVISRLYASVLEMQQELLMAQNREYELLSRCRALEEQIAHAKDWRAENARYVLRSVAGGVVRQRKADDASGDPPHWLCPNCFEEERKSYLQKDVNIVDGRNVWKCPRCSTAVVLDKDTSEETMITPETPSSPRPRDD